MKYPFLKPLSLSVIVFSFCSVGWIRGELSPESKKKLGSGDRAAFSAVAQSTNLDDLNNVLMLALTRQFGAYSSEVKEIAITAIRRIPDHGKTLGDKIEELSDQRGTARKRERAFYLLQNIASPDAIAQIGRFLFDERNPEKGLPLNDGSFEVPNSHWAANAMGSALGDRIGLKRKPGFYGPDEVKAWQIWWQSPAADSFREPIAIPFALPGGTPQKADEAKPSTNSESTVPSRWLIWTVTIATAIALLWMFLKIRKLLMGK
ncbi:hypothetical protein BH11VER1_BH11VER1_41800 [soil metagenome]